MTSEAHEGTLGGRLKGILGGTLVDISVETPEGISERTFKCTSRELQNVF